MCTDGNLPWCLWRARAFSLSFSLCLVQNNPPFPSPPPPPPPPPNSKNKHNNNEQKQHVRFIIQNTFMNLFWKRSLFTSCSDRWMLCSIDLFPMALFWPPPPPSSLPHRERERERLFLYSHNIICPSFSLPSPWAEITVPVGWALNTN